MATAAKADAHDRDKGLTPDMKRHMAEIRAQRALTVAITNESWGKSLSPVQRHAFAEYMRRFRLDISEIDNLGGKPYRNGNYYKRRIAELRAQGRVEWSEGEHIGHDERLDLMAEDIDDETARYGKTEGLRRLKERIRLAVPNDATHAYVVRVKLKADGKAQEGCDWITPSRVKKAKKFENNRFVGWEDKIADPVGAEEPEKTCVTRAWRRVGLLVAAEIPELRHEEEIMDAEAEAVEAEVERVGDEEAEREEAAAIRPKDMLVAGIDPSDPYGFNGTTAGRLDRRERVEVPRAGQPTDDDRLDAQRFHEDEA